MRDERAFLADMLFAARSAVRFVGIRTRDEFLADDVVREAVIRQITIIGEAARHISEPTRLSLPELPFAAMAAMRNVVVHVYWGVNLEIVWSTATSDMAVLIGALETHLGPDADAVGGSTP